MVTQNSLATEVHVLASGSKGNCTLIRRGESFILHDAGISYNLQKSNKQLLAVTFNLQNFTNAEYESNAWVYRYIYENAQNQLLGYYPQALINWNAGLVLSF